MNLSLRQLICLLGLLTATKASAAIQVADGSEKDSSAGDQVLQAEQTLDSANDLQSMPKGASLDDLISRSKQATVVIVGYKDAKPNKSFRHRFLGAIYTVPLIPTTETATGTFIDSEHNLVLTSAPDFQTYDRFEVLDTSTNQEFAGTAQIVATDDEMGITIFQLSNPPKNRIVLPLGKSDAVKVGDWVMTTTTTISYSKLPYSFTPGFISGTNRSITVYNQDHAKNRHIRKHANILQSHGLWADIGTPVLNSSGEIIAIHSATCPYQQDISLAIPIDDIKPIITAIKQQLDSQAQSEQSASSAS